MSPLALADPATSIDWKPFLDLLLGPLGLTVGLLLVAFAFAREWVVPGSRYRRDISDQRAIIRDLTDRVGDVAKEIAERNTNDQARLDVLRGSPGLSAGLADAEHQIRSRRARPRTAGERTP